jgi:hypothetical protein
LKHQIDSGLGAQAAWILLYGNARHLDLPWISPFVQYLINAVSTLAVKNLKEALMVLESIRVCGEAFGRQQRRKQSAAGALTYMHRLSHGTQVRLETRRHRRAEGQRMRCTFFVEA